MKSKKESYILLIIVIGLFAIAFIRLYFLMVVKQEYYNDRLLDKTKRSLLGSSAPRGRILDRNGKVLVDNVGIKTIVYSKIRGTKTSEEIEIAKELATILEIDKLPTESQIKEYWIITNKDESNDLITNDEKDQFKKRKLTQNELHQLKKDRIPDSELEKYQEEELKTIYILAIMNTGYSHDIKVIKEKNVTEDEYAKVNELNLKGVRGELSWERTYPYDNVFRMILGNVSSSTTGIPAEYKDEYLSKGYSLNDRVGISYLEKQYEEYLKGEKAVYAINNDNSLTLIKLGSKGNDLYLSIDIELQKKLEEILVEEIIAGKKLKNTEYYNHSYSVINDPNTGEILAMSGKQVLIDNAEEPTISDVTPGIITSSYAMGSVIKGASMAVGFDNDIIKPNQRMIDGCVKLYLVPRKCSFERLGPVNDIKAMAMSSNYYQYQIAIGLTGKKYIPNIKLNVTDKEFNIYRKMFNSFGLGKKTEIDLPNEKPGITGKLIADDLLLNLAIGQYDTYTPISLLQYANTVATAKRIAPSLMKKIVSPEGKTIKELKPKVLNDLDLKEEHLERIRLGFIEVLKSGTGRGYTDVKYKPAGKTGTSESFLDGDNDGIAEIKTISSAYAMYAPYDNPKYSMIVMSPNVSHKEGDTEYLAFINRYISKRISKHLFEEYDK